MTKIKRKPAVAKVGPRQSKLSPSFQTTITADALRVLGWKPGLRFNQIVEGDRLILEPLADVEALAGSLGTGSQPPTVDELSRGTKTAIAKAAMKGLARDE